MTAHPRPSPPARRLLVVALLLALAVAACSASDSGDDSAATDEVEAAATAVEQAADGDDAAEDREVGLAAGEAADGQDAPAPTAEGDDGADAAPVLPPDTATTGERIIKEGTVTVEVEPGDFDSAFGQIVARAQALGGHVSGTSSSTEEGPDDETLTRGQVTIRIPVRNFEDLLTSLGDAGTVVDRNITSQDVTAEYTDLESRRRNLQAQERFYLGLLEEAAGVTDAIAVQQQLDDIQAQIEQITGRLNLLGDRSAFSTLTVQIHERGAEPTDVEPIEEPGGLTPYIEDAVDTFITTVGALIIAATFIAPFLVIGLVAFGIWRAVVRSRRTVPTPPPAQPAPREPVGVGVGTAGPDEDG